MLNIFQKEKHGKEALRPLKILGDVNSLMLTIFLNFFILSYLLRGQNMYIYTKIWINIFEVKYKELEAQNSGHIAEDLQKELLEIKLQYKRLQVPCSCFRILMLWLSFTFINIGGCFSAFWLSYCRKSMIPSVI